MAQGKLKVKSKLPPGVKQKKKGKGKAKGSAVTKRINAPVPSTAIKRNKMKANVTKMVNAAAEKQLRALATNTPQLSEAQQRVAKAPTAPTAAK